MSLRPTHLHISVSLSSDQWQLVAGSCVRHLVCSAPSDVLPVGANLESLCLVGPTLVHIVFHGGELGTLTANGPLCPAGAFMSRVTYRGRKSIALADALADPDTVYSVPIASSVSFETATEEE
jgi:hypothetical protein